MASSFSRQRKPKYGEDIVRLTNLLQYDVKAKYRLILEVLGHEVFSPEGVRLINQKPHAFVSAR